MPVIQRSDIRNTLISLLSDQAFDSLKADLEAVDLPRKFVIAEPDKPAAFVYFLDSGIGSVVTTSPEGQQAEAGLYGRDGFSPIGVLLGADRSPHASFIQESGRGWRIATERLVAACERDSTMRNLLLRYVQTYVVQSCYTALSNAVHPIGERLARWLLMCLDRTDSMYLDLTHEFLGIMLAVRRPSVTTSLHVLEGNHLIRSERGRITIRDRKGLEEFAGDAYGKPEAEYRRLIG